MSDTTKLCINCKYYQQKESADEDRCRHHCSRINGDGVRTSIDEFYRCRTMLMSHCVDHLLFSQKSIGGLDEADALRAEDRETTARHRAFLRGDVE